MKEIENMENEKNKKIKIIMPIIAIIAVIMVFCVIMTNHDRNYESYDKSDVIMKGDKKIDLKILSLDNEQIEIKITNNDTSVFQYTDYFVCSGKKDNQWKDIKFRYDVGFKKCVYELKAGESTVRKIRWDDYFGHRLDEGEYRLYWIDQTEFVIIID